MVTMDLPLYVTRAAEARKAWTRSLSVRVRVRPEEEEAAAMKANQTPELSH